MTSSCPIHVAFGKAVSKTVTGGNKNNFSPRKRGCSLPDISTSMPTGHESRYRRLLNYYPDYLEVRQQRKQREVNVEYGRDTCTGKHFIRVWKGDQTIEYINIDKHEFCGVQRWHFTKMNSGWKNARVKKTFIAIVLKNATYVFQQMNKDSLCEGKPDFLMELENVMKEDLGIKNWWKCVTCHTSTEHSPINLHLTKNALSMVNGKEHCPTCLKRWNITEVKDCQVLDGDGSQFIVQFHSGCQLKCASGLKSQEISELIKSTIRPTVPPRPKKKLALLRSFHSFEQTRKNEPENSFDKLGPLGCTLPYGWRPGDMFKNGADNRSGHTWDFNSDVSENNTHQSHVEVKDCTGSCDEPVPGVTCMRKKYPLVRQRSVCSGIDNNWRASGSIRNSHRSSSHGDLSDIQDMDFNMWDNTDKEAGRQPMSKWKQSEKRSTMKKKLDRLMTRDQMSIRKSVKEATGTCNRKELTKQISIWEFEAHSKNTSDVVYTLNRIMEKKPPKKDTLGLPWLLYQTVCCKLIPDPNCCGLTKDWRFLAENIGFHNEDIQMIESFVYQTPICTPQHILLQCWQDRHNRLQSWYTPACTAKHLVNILEKMDRKDIAEIIRNAKK